MNKILLKYPRLLALSLVLIVAIGAVALHEVLRSKRNASPKVAATMQSPKATDSDTTRWKTVFASVHATPVKDLVLAEVPELQTPDLPEAQRVNLIRHWVAQQIDVAAAIPSDCLSIAACREQFYKVGIDKVIAAFRENKIGVLCGGSADTLKMVYDAFGYKTFTLSMGIVGRFTHLVTVVEIPQNDQKQLIIQDALLDTSYHAPDGHPLDYFEMISLLKQGQADQVIPTNPDGIVRDTTLGAGPPGMEVRMAKRSMNLQTDLLDEPLVVGTLKVAGCPINSTYLYALPLAFYWAPPDEAKALGEKAHSILGDMPCAPAT
jgi:hypothetical protein